MSRRIYTWYYDINIVYLSGFYRTGYLTGDRTVSIAWHSYMLETYICIYILRRTALLVATITRKLV